MNSTGVLGDYLDELLGEAIVATPPATPSPDNAGPCQTNVATPEREPTWDDLPAEVIYETGAVVAQPAADDAALEAAFDAASTPATMTDTEREPTWDDLPAEVIYETETVAPTAEDTAALEAPFEAATSDSAGPRPAGEAAAEREPTWDDLPDEVIYETDPAGSHQLAHTDSPGLQAAFEAAAGGEDVPTPPPAVVASPAPRPAPVPAPAARAAAAPPPRVAVDAPATSRPGTWQELQAQAHQPASSPHPQNRRAGERTSRWLRLRCGTQAYALELLKVQEVVLPVPLLPLRGTAPAMLGIMNLRGQVVPVMDLGLHLGAAAAEDDAQTRIVVLEEDGETIGLRVSAVEDVANLTDSQIEPPDTARICQISNDLFRGVARVSQRPMILLDATRLLS
ncbi:chemotaxis protein CheW [Stenotrophomonas sp. PSU_St99]